MSMQLRKRLRSVVTSLHLTVIFITMPVALTMICSWFWGRHDLPWLCLTQFGMIGLSIIQMSTYSLGVLPGFLSRPEQWTLHCSSIPIETILWSIHCVQRHFHQRVDRSQIAGHDFTNDQPLLNSNRTLTIAIGSSIINQSCFYPRRPCSARIVVRTDRLCVPRHFSTGMLTSIAKAC